MKITDLKIDIHRNKPSSDPKRDALQTLPGSGSVRVTIETDDGITGTGESGFGRIAGAPDALAQLADAKGSPLKIENGYVNIPNGSGFSW